MWTRTMTLQFLNFYLQCLLIVEPVLAVEVRQHIVQHLELFLCKNVIQQLPDEDNHNQLKIVCCNSCFNRSELP